MKLSRIFLIFIIYFIVAPAFSQENLTQSSKMDKQTEENIEITLDNFSGLTWVAKEKEFSKVLKKIEDVNPSDDKELILARVYSIYPGQDQVNIRKAEALIEDYIRKYPESHQGYLVYANMLIEKIFSFYSGEEPSKWKHKPDIQRREKALINIEKSLSIKESSEGYQLKAILSDGEDKIELLEKSIVLKSANNEAWRELVKELKRKHRYDEAILKLDLWDKNTHPPELRIEILLEHAEVLIDKREPESAIKLLNYALSIRENTGDHGLEKLYSSIDKIYLKLARAYKDAGYINQSEKYYKYYLAINPKHWYVRFDLALLYSSNGQSNKAISEYEQVLAYHENDSSSLYNLGLLYEKIDKEKSKEYFIKYIELNIDNKDKHSIKWVENAQSELRSLGVYDYPTSKSKINDLESHKSSTGKLLLLLTFILLSIPLAWKYKKVTRFLIIAAMTLAIAIISILEAQSYSPSLVAAFLYFIPIICIGTLLLYVFRKRL